MPQRGILDVSYYSGEMVGKKGCLLNMPYRRSLLYLVIIILYIYIYCILYI